MPNDIANEERLLAAAAYAFFIPSLYIILTDKRKDHFLSYAAAQSLFLWIFYGLMVLVVHFVRDLIWTLAYFPLLEPLTGLVYLAMLVFALFLASRSLFGENRKVPYISALADKLC
ncbi:MAG TPA: hypothetical protein VMD02_02940 [Candidatus Omnitrophota bacterium]|nr:hypothetical protein [Candidatus Omnitrophota bacterium]